jgi:hypothetical protein
VILRIQKTYENVGLKLCYNYATGFGAGQENKSEVNQIFMVPRGGIEPPTRGFSNNLGTEYNNKNNSLCDFIIIMFLVMLYECVDVIIQKLYKSGIYGAF